MPDDLTVSRVGAPSPHPEPAAKPPVTADAAVIAPGYANPSMRLDPALGMVVIAFHDEQGAVTTSIPSQQQLDAYRTWERTHNGLPPPGAKV